jgi:hypothetical protein
MNSSYGNPRLFGGRPGERVPEVGAEDLKALWRVQQEVQARHPGTQVGTGMDIAQQICKPGADIQAIGYRLGMLWLMSQVVGERFSQFTKDGQPSDAAFRAAAKIPVAWMGGPPTQQPPFDVEEFLRLCGE